MDDSSSSYCRSGAVDRTGVVSRQPLFEMVLFFLFYFFLILDRCDSQRCPPPPQEIHRTMTFHSSRLLRLLSLGFSKRPFHRADFRSCGHNY